tara:strand:+ start:9990 stop:11204 length:1215 start_codon:yes stop_codon:yes gene_type:complete
MKKTCFFILLLISTLHNVLCQELKLSNHSEISIITVAPGELLYEAFGHSAIRVKDSVLGIDNIFNYGLFDFNQPNFYVNFVKGKLLYKVGKQSFRRFITSYAYQKRWIKEQILNLSQSEKQNMFALLEENTLPKNSEYLYDPYFNNCATKLRDITKNILGVHVQFSSSFSNENYTLRKLMDKEIHWNTWGNFGINLALGNTLDKAITAEDYMYLPDYVYQAFKRANITKDNLDIPLVKKEQIVLNFKEIKIKQKWYNPFFIFSIILLLSIMITYRDHKRNKRTKLLDFSLFFMTGLLGLVICFLWFFTNHSSTPNNFNFLWAFFPNLFVAFILLQNNIPKWVVKYINFYLVLLTITLFVFILGRWNGVNRYFFALQEFSFVLLPIISMLFMRFFYLHKILNAKK